MSPISDANTHSAGDEEHALMQALCEDLELAAADGLRQPDFRESLSRFLELRSAFDSALEECYPEGGGQETSRLATPTDFPGYTILAEAGRGGFGVVYRARDEKLGREVALKLLLPKRQLSASAKSRFLEEARALASIRHPNVLTIHAVLEHGDQIALVTELIEGETLDELLSAKGPLSASESAAIGAEICRALAAVHAAGLIHRDVKTTNILRERGGRLVLTDFGLGVFAEGQEERKVAEGPAGSPLFMAPEQIRARSADARTDVYSLGIVLYNLVSGRFPFDGDTAEALFENIQSGRGISLRDARPDLPESVVRVIGRALAAEPEKRFQTAGEFEEALLETLEPVSARKPAVEEVSAAPRQSLVEGALPQGALVDGGSRTGRGFPWRWALGMGAAAALVLAVLWGPSVFEPRAPASLVVKTAELHLDSEVVKPPLETNARITAGEDGDAVYLEFEAEQRVYIYVLNEDQEGSRFLLFPLPGGEKQNPLAGGERHRLPGEVWGDERTWGFSESGGDEKVFILASLEPLEPLEAAARKWTNDLALGYPQIDEVAVRSLRGMSILDEAKKSGKPKSEDSLEDIIDKLVQSSQLKGKVWRKKYVFEKR